MSAEQSQPEHGVLFLAEYALSNAEDSLRAQREDLNSLRNRASFVIVTNALVAPFFSESFKDEQIFQIILPCWLTMHSRDLAITCLVFSVMLCMLIFLSTKGWRFFQDQTDFYEKRICVDNGLTQSDLVFIIAMDREESFAHNARRLRWLQRFLAISVGLVGLQVAFWVI